MQTDNQVIRGKGVKENNSRSETVGLSSINDNTNSQAEVPFVIWVMGKFHLTCNLDFGEYHENGKSIPNFKIVSLWAMNITFYLGGPGSSKAEQVDKILDKKRFYHINMGKLLMEELKHPHANNGLVMNNEETNMQKYFADWQNGELLNSVRYYLNVQNTRPWGLFLF